MSELKRRLKRTLHDISLSEVSLVDLPAIESRYLLYKRKNNEEESDAQFDF
jgi:hypothetical protein